MSPNSIQDGLKGERRGDAATTPHFLLWMDEILHRRNPGMMIPL